MNKHPSIYLDNNASTMLCQEAVEVLKEALGTFIGNPSSVHSKGRLSQAHLSEARQAIASFLKTSPEEIIFTSGGTESLSLLIRGFASYGDIITTHLEHDALYQTIRAVKAKHEIHYVPCDAWGAPRLEEIQKKITKQTKILALSAVNAETGCKIDLEAIASLAQEYGLIFLVDGVALLGKEPFYIPSGVTGMAFSGHKIHALQGVGFCYLNGLAPAVTPHVVGGHQESHHRAGTENLFGILSLHAAIDVLNEQQHQIHHHLCELKTHFEHTLLSAIEGAEINGEAPRINNTSNLYFPGIDAETLLIVLDQKGVQASHGSACSSGSLEPSRVLFNMGFSKERSKSSIRFSFSRMTTRSDIDKASAIIIETIYALKKAMTSCKNFSGAST